MRANDFILCLPLTALALLVVGNAVAAPASKTPGYVPILMPSGCSETEPRVLLWQNRTDSTVCIKPQELLKAMLPGCKAGQQVFYDGKAFACADPAKPAKAGD